jgi:cysteine-rich repeat protein
MLSTAWARSTSGGHFLHRNRDQRECRTHSLVEHPGIHEEIARSILLSDDGTNSALCVQETAVAASVCTGIDVPVSDSVNEIVVFQAERHVTASNYTLTLRGFEAPITTCVPVCGNGIITPDETCDDGPRNGTAYGTCNTDCTPGPRCGDGLVNGPEQCDPHGDEQCDGGNRRNGDGCNVNCITEQPPR